VGALTHLNTYCIRDHQDIDLFMEFFNTDLNRPR